MASNKEDRIFKNGSTTFYNASRFFPKRVRDDIYTLYAFARTADDYVDQIPPDTKGFAAFKNAFYKARAGQRSGNDIIDNFIKLEAARKFEHEWSDRFLQAMESDIGTVHYKTLEELRWYTYGSAEVMGLYLQCIFGMPKKARPYMIYQGLAFQYINFIRDIMEDNELGRKYIPDECTKKHGLATLSYESARANPRAFKNCIKAELGRYRHWESQAAQGLHLYPVKYRIAVQTARDMYLWTARQIEKDPFIIFTKKVKPSKTWVITHGIANLARSATWT